MLAGSRGENMKGQEMWADEKLEEYHVTISLKIWTEIHSFQYECMNTTIGKMEKLSHHNEWHAVGTTLRFYDTKDWEGPLICECSVFP